MNLKNRLMDTKNPLQQRGLKTKKPQSGLFDHSFQSGAQEHKERTDGENCAGLSALKRNAIQTTATISKAHHPSLTKDGVLTAGRFSCSRRKKAPPERGLKTVGAGAPTVELLKPKLRRSTRRTGSRSRRRTRRRPCRRRSSWRSCPRCCGCHPATGRCRQHPA